MFDAFGGLPPRHVCFKKLIDEDAELRRGTRPSVVMRPCDLDSRRGQALPHVVGSAVITVGVGKHLTCLPIVV